jgi:hypothetical protein
MPSISRAVKRAMVGTSLSWQSPHQLDVVIARMRDTSVPEQSAVPEGDLFIQQRRLGPTRLRVSAMRQGTKNGNAAEFSGRLEPTAEGCRLEGHIRLANMVRLILMVMFAVPGWVLIKAITSDQAPASGIAVALFVIVVLSGFVVFMAFGFAQREPFLRSWLMDAVTADGQ